MELESENAVELGAAGGHMEKCTAIVLAAGQGKRMGTKVQKQYLEIDGYPVLYYSLQAFQQSCCIDEIILVTGAEDVMSCQESIVKRYAFTKVKAVVPGGKERYDSVYQGLQHVTTDTTYVFIHDGARPMLNEQIIQAGLASVKQYQATVAGVPSKDTVKLVDVKGYAQVTPDRKTVWTIQTPQIIEAKLIQTAYEKMMESPHENVTDDAMVVETYGNFLVKVYLSDYENIKITTPEDLEIAKLFLHRQRGE